MKENNRIPKVIHYFWFGQNEKPEIFNKCLESWKKYCANYEIKEWNEQNFDVNINNYTSQAYQKGKYAFVSDYARFYVLYNYGGIYVDIDVEFLRNIDDLLKENVFMGFEDRGQVNPGLITGARKNEKLIKEILDIYDNFEKFPNYDHNICQIVTKYLKETRGLQTESEEIQHLNGVTIYPFKYFCACDLITKKTCISKETYSIHHYNASWLPLKVKIKNKIRKMVYTIVGRNNYDKLKATLKRKR